MSQPTVADISPALQAAQLRLKQLRQAFQGVQPGRERHTTPWQIPHSTPTPSPVTQPETKPTHPESTRLWPDLAMAMLREGVVAPGRVWLLLRLIDKPGRGWVCRQEMRQRLTDKTSALRICGWRQLRNLLNQGNETFWQQKNDRIWLKSPAKVAQSLGIERLITRPVALPINSLTQSIGRVRAHFYASFHSGREGKPIARQTLTDLCDVSRATQRTYETETGVKATANWGIGDRASKIAIEEYAWQHGQAMFTLKDRLGKLGQPGRAYLARQLPNSYQGPHQTLSKKSQKRINRNLADLFTHGITGNGNGMIDTRFFTDGRQARLNGSVDSYWPSDMKGVWHEAKCI